MLQLSLWQTIELQACYSYVIEMHTSRQNHQIQDLDTVCGKFCNTWNVHQHLPCFICYSLTFNSIYHLSALSRTKKKFFWQIIWQLELENTLLHPARSFHNLGIRDSNYFTIFLCFFKDKIKAFFLRYLNYDPCWFIDLSMPMPGQCPSITHLNVYCSNQYRVCYWAYTF